MSSAGWAGLAVLLLLAAVVVVVQRDQGQAELSEGGEAALSIPGEPSKKIPADSRTSHADPSQTAEFIDEEAFFLPTTPEIVRQRIWEDVVDGEVWRKLDFSLRVLESPDFGWRLPARQLLLLYLGEDPGDDYSLWRPRVIEKWSRQQVDNRMIIERLKQHKAKQAQQP